jgi:hypothetical protein
MAELTGVNPYNSIGISPRSERAELLQSVSTRHSGVASRDYVD